MYKFHLYVYIMLDKLSNTLCIYIKKGKILLINGSNKRAIEYKKDYTVSIIDQTLLPHNLEYKILSNISDVTKAIKNMLVRGAPLIGVTASYGMCFAIKEDPSIKSINNAFNILVKTRPTAVDLRWALENFVKEILNFKEADRFICAWKISNALLENSVKQCSDIGDNGLNLINKIYKSKTTLNILTHCNAGWLACVDWGTALAPIYKAFNSGIDIHVWVDETRPRYQGASLTCWELSQHGVPNTLIVDNAGGHLMQKGMVDMCIVGSDRTASNGDVCNKIGTYMKALCAFDNNIPFYVALPESTIDFNLKSGVNNIEIEERSKKEVTHITGLDKEGELNSVKIVGNECIVCNPGFDVTPSKLVTKLITNRGVCNASIKGIKDLFK